MGDGHYKVFMFRRRWSYIDFEVIPTLRVGTSLGTELYMHMKKLNMLTVKQWILVAAQQGGVVKQKDDLPAQYLKVGWQHQLAGNQMILLHAKMCT